MYEREISRESGLSIGAVNQGLRKLEQAEIISREKKGKMYFYSVNHHNPLVKQFKIFLSVFDLSQFIKDIRDNCDRIVLYGSCAFGEDYEDSDVDLIFLTREKGLIKKELTAFSKKFPRKISATIINNSEWLETKKLDITFYNEVNKGIILWRGKE
jgi:predicted nucleotidyltransferase